MKINEINLMAEQQQNDTNHLNQKKNEKKA